jgi:heme oxygenase
MSASKDNLHGRLRRATRELHEELEGAVGIGDRIATRGRYCDYLSQLWALHVSAEAALAAFDFRPLGFSYPAPYRSKLLAADLGYLGMSADELELLPLPTAPQLGTTAGALGAVYVVEGSAKGARAILPEITAALGFDARHGASFFAGFGLETKLLWQACLAAINALAPNSAEADLMVDAARATFAMFRQGLVPEENVASPLMRETVDLLEPARS